MNKGVHLQVHPFSCKARIINYLKISGTNSLR